MDSVGLHQRPPRRGLIRLGLLELELDAGRPVVFDPLLDGIRRDYAHAPGHLGRLRFAEARLAWRAERPAEAHVHAQAAVELYGTGVQVEDYDQHRVRAWIDAHPVP